METKGKSKSVLAWNIIRRREALGLSAEKFAEIAGVPYPTLRDIEADISAGRRATKEKIAKAFGCGVDDLNQVPVESAPISPDIIEAIRQGAAEVLGTKPPFAPDVMEIISKLTPRQKFDLEDIIRGATKLWLSPEAFEERKQEAPSKSKPIRRA